jgi:hypothetical protein
VAGGNLREFEMMVRLLNECLLKNKMDLSSGDAAGVGENHKWKQSSSSGRFIFMQFSSTIRKLFCLIASLPP